MKIPDNTTVFEGELATFWFDENGILYALSKNTPRTLERQKENYQFIKKITGNHKVCLLCDTTNSSLQGKETRDYSATQLPNYFHAMAVISKSAIGKFLTNVFLKLKNQPVPITFFNNEIEAKEWLKKYL